MVSLIVGFWPFSAVQLSIAGWNITDGHERP